MIGRRRLLLAGAGGLAAAMLAACGGSDKDKGSGDAAAGTTGSATAVTGVGKYTYAPKTGRMREAMTVFGAGLPAGMDLANELSNVGTRVTCSVFDTLIRRDFLNNDALLPALAVTRAAGRPDDGAAPARRRQLPQRRSAHRRRRYRCFVDSGTWVR